MPGSYYNENDPFAAEWLRRLIKAGLIPAGDVDDRDIQKISGDELSGYTQVHLFAGIGGWPYALHLAGVSPEFPVWTGSCPCQPFSIAGRQLGTSDERHLWPEMLRLIRKRGPSTILGEQVASGDGRAWLSGVRSDLEELGYAFGAADLCAAGLGAPHIRQRLFWVGDASGPRRDRKSNDQIRAGWNSPEHAGADDGLADAQCAEPWAGEPSEQGQSRVWRAGSAIHGAVGNDRMEHAVGAGLEERSRIGRIQSGADVANPWEASVVASCLDGKFRRIPCPESGVLPLAYGLPDRVGPGVPILRELVDDSKANRAGRLSGYGNAIVPQIAAVFIRAAVESMKAAS